MSFIHSIAAIHEQITLQTEVASIRAAILKLLRERIGMRRNLLQERESEHFSNAITALTMNMHAPKQPSYSWLRLCLVDLEKAIASTILQDRNHHSPDTSASDAKYANLMNAVAALEHELSDGLNN